MAGWHHWLNGHECEWIWEIRKDREAWWAVVRGVAESDTAEQLNNNKNLLGNRQNQSVRGILLLPQLWIAEALHSKALSLATSNGTIWLSSTECFQCLLKYFRILSFVFQSSPFFSLLCWNEIICFSFPSKGKKKKQILERKNTYAVCWFKNRKKKHMVSGTYATYIYLEILYAYVYIQWALHSIWQLNFAQQKMIISHIQ